MQTLSPSAVADALAMSDLTDPHQGPHALQELVTDVSEALARAWSAEVREIRTPRVVSVADNYEQLGYPPDAVTRDARYSRYLSREQMLRSHTSAGIPAAVRALAAEDPPPPDVLLVLPGLCYRRDSIDRLHTGTPHQLDLWRICVDPPMTEGDLTEMTRLVIEQLLPGGRWRLTPAAHPYTQGGRQIDVADHGDWVEVGECGLASQALLARSGLPGPWTGLAMGLGLDRLLMLRKGVPDIRLLRSADPRVQDQMRDLTPYRPVSHMPAIRRDISVAVWPEAGPDPDDSGEQGWAEAVGDRVREALGADAELLESVQVLAETPCDELPPPAQARMGSSPGQVNLLMRVTLRALEHTLTDPDANRIRDRIYAALHQGSADVVGVRT